VGLVCLVNGNLAIGAAAADLQHELTQTETHKLPQGEEGKPCDHCCACHYTAHLFSTTSARAAGVDAVLAETAAVMHGAPAAPRPPDSFFRPPRIS